MVSIVWKLRNYMYTRTLFGKYFVKVTYSLKKFLNSWFDEKKNSVKANLSFFTPCFTYQPLYSLKKFREIIFFTLFQVRLIFYVFPHCVSGQKQENHVHTFTSNFKNISWKWYTIDFTKYFSKNVRVKMYLFTLWKQITLLFRRKVDFP